MVVIGDNGAAPAWTPDGKRIVYQAEIDGAKQLFLINPDGTGKKQLTSGRRFTWRRRGRRMEVDLLPVAGGRHLGIWRYECGREQPGQVDRNVPPVDWAFERLAVAGK